MANALGCTKYRHTSSDDAPGIRSAFFCKDESAGQHLRGLYLRSLPRDLEKRQNEGG